MIDEEDTTPVPLDEAERRGWISAAERRLYEGTASLADLLGMGYDDAEAQEMLAVQERNRACTSPS